MSTTAPLGSLGDRLGDDRRVRRGDAVAAGGPFGGPTRAADGRFGAEEREDGFAKRASCDTAARHERSPLAASRTATLSTRRLRSALYSIASLVSWVGNG